MSRSKSMPISIRGPARDPEASLTEAEQELLTRRGRNRAELVNKVGRYIDNHRRKGERRIRKSEVERIRQFATRKFDRWQEQLCWEVCRALKSLHRKR